MNPAFIGLINNILLLIALTVVYEISYSFPAKIKKLSPVISGFLIGVFAIAIMSFPMQFAAGIFFDARTVLLGVTALIFGGMPALIAAAMATIYRIGIGGDGVYMGVAMIVSAAVIGYIWRRFLLKRYPGRRWLNIYLCGLAIHAAMLLCIFLLPDASRLPAFDVLALPVLVIFPVITVLLSLLLLRQKERSEAAAIILEVESRYKSLFEENHAVMLLVDPVSGQIANANNAASQFYGWTVDQLKSMHYSQVHTLSMEEIKDRLRKAVTQEKSYFRSRHKKSSGQVVDVEIYSGPINFNGKKMIYSIIHDVSDRTAAIAALQESENRFRSLFEGAPDSIFIETNKNFSFINNAGIRLLGADSRDQLIGQPILNFIHPDFHAAVEERIKILKKEKLPVPLVEEVYLQMDGTPVWVEVQAIPIDYDETDGVIVFAHDLTVQKKLQSANAEIEAQLRQQQKLEAIGTLAGGVAHEINNPINGIINYAQLILDSNAENESISEYAGEIIHESERISEIVKNLLQFSRIEKQSHSYASVYDIINQTVSLIRTIIKKDQIDLVIALQENLPDIKCRSQQIQQVLMNLLTNARDASNEKFPQTHPDKAILLTCGQFQKEGRKWIRIKVEDHGKGIPKAIQDKIFEPFFSTKTKDKGTGLGLSISFGIVQDHHGRLYMQTREGHYTRFILELPVDNGWDLQKDG